MSVITKLHDGVLTVGVALDGAGWDPASWRTLPDPASVFTTEYWVDLARTAEIAGIAYLTLEDELHLQGASAIGEVPRSDALQGRLDALLTLTAVAARTSTIGLIPVVTVTHTEPFHVATALQTLDHVSLGRAGWQLRVSAGSVDAAAFGRRSPESLRPEALAEEAADVAEASRALWDSWEDDAVIRDVPTGRFLDRDRLHHVDFVGDTFSVAGPSIVPRSPQGQLPITLLAETAETIALASRIADVIFLPPASGTENAAERIREVRDAEALSDRGTRGLEALRIVADLDVGGQRDRERGPGPVADRISAWHAAGADGVRLRPRALPLDLAWIAEELLPELRHRTLVERARPHRERPSTGDAPSLRSRFGLSPSRNRFAEARPAGASDRTAQEVHA